MIGGLLTLLELV